MIQTHINCENVRCQICMNDHMSVGRRLEKLTGDKQHDHMGRFHSWLTKHGYEPETDHGWGTEHYFNDGLMKAYANDYKEFNKE